MGASESDYRDVIYLTSGRLGIVSIKDLDKMGVLKNVKTARAADRGDLSGVADIASVQRSLIREILLKYENPPGLNIMLGRAGLNTFVQVGYNDVRPICGLMKLLKIRVDSWRARGCGVWLRRPPGLRLPNAFLRA